MTTRGGGRPNRHTGDHCGDRRAGCEAVKSNSAQPRSLNPKLGSLAALRQARRQRRRIVDKSVHTPHDVTKPLSINWLLPLGGGMMICVLVVAGGLPAAVAGSSGWKA